MNGPPKPALKVISGSSRKPVYAPERECRADDPHPKIEIDLANGQVVSTPTLEIRGTADATGYFESWKLEIGLGTEPTQWMVLNGGNTPVNNALLHLLDLSTIPNGIVTLRLTVTGKYGEVERFVHLNLSLPTPTAPPTETPTVPPTETPTLIPSVIPPTDTPTIPIPTDTPSLTPMPSETPTATP